MIKNTFAKGPEGWCSYEYHASVIAKSEIFVMATQTREGGVGNSAFIFTDHTRWSADTPEKPISILAYIYYLRWTDRDPMDLRGAEVSVYLRGDNLQLSGAKCYFWVNSPGVRWHLTSRPLECDRGALGQGTEPLYPGERREPVAQQLGRRAPSDPIARFHVKPRAQLRFLVRRI